MSAPDFDKLFHHLEQTLIEAHKLQSRFLVHLLSMAALEATAMLADSLKRDA